MQRLSIIILLFISAVSNTLVAQVLRMQASNVQYEDALRESVRLTLDVPLAEVKSSFNDFIKDRFNTDLKGYGFLARKDEVSTEFQSLPLLSNQAIKLIGKFEESGNETALYLLAQWEDGSMISSSADTEEFTKLKKIGQDFMQFAVPRYINNLIAEAQKTFDKSQNDLEKSESDLQKARVDLNDLRQETIELENEIEENEKSLRTLRKLNESEKQVLDDLQKKREKANNILSGLGKV